MADNNNLKNALQALTSKIERNFQYLKNLVSSYVEYDDTDIQTAVQNLDDNKVDKITGKALSSNDFTNTDKNKLDNLSNYDDSELRQLIGTKQASGDYVTTSDLNQRGFLTEHQSLDNYYTKTAADSKFLTEHQSLSDYYTKTQIDNKGYLTQHQDVSEKVNYSDLSAVATTGSYNDLSDKPAIPSAVTESTVSGWGFTKNTGTVTSVNNTTPVNGNVTLSIPEQVQSDWNVTNTSSKAYIKNKPTIPDTSNMVTTNTTQTISGQKTLTVPVNFKQNSARSGASYGFLKPDDTQGGYVEFNDAPSVLVDDKQTLLIGNYATNVNEETYLGFTSHYPSYEYKLVAPLARNVSTETDLDYLGWNKFYMPLGFTDGNSIIKTSNGGMVDISTFLANYVSTGDLATTLSNYVQSSNLSTVATSGSYNDLLDKPTIPSTTVFEQIGNKVTSISSSSTNTQYPSAKCVYDLIGNIETLLSEV